MDDLDQKAQRLRVLWKSGRDKYVSFFATLDEVRQEIGNEALPGWCFDHLRIGLSTISNTKQILIKADADVVARNLTEARAAEKAARQQERLERELEKQERDKRVAEAKAATERAKTDVEHAKAETQKVRKATRRKSKDQSERKRRALVANISDADLAALVRRFRKAEALCQEGERQWIEGSIAIALILHAARIKLPADQAFSDWLAVNNIYPGSENRDVRAALIGLGGHGEMRLREILTATTSRSYILIWRDNRVVSVSKHFDTAEGEN